MGLSEYVTYRRLFGTTVLVASIGSGVGHANPLCGELSKRLTQEEWVFRVTLGRRSRHPDFGLAPTRPLARIGAAGGREGLHAAGDGAPVSLAGDDIRMSSLCATPAVAPMADSGRMLSCGEGNAGNHFRAVCGDARASVSAATAYARRDCSMASSSRRKLLGRARKSVFHCSTRCVRRAFLCGQDPLTGKDYSHRRDWIINREEQLAQLFTIEVEFRAEMSNHLHAVLRTRPEIAKRLPPREVARRWLTITKLAKSMSDEMPEPDEKKIDKLVGDKKRIAELRRRLSSISWFMGTLWENIARARIARMVPPADFGRLVFDVVNVPM